MIGWWVGFLTVLAIAYAVAVWRTRVVRRRRRPPFVRLVAAFGPFQQALREAGESARRAADAFEQFNHTWQAKVEQAATRHEETD